MSNETKNFTSMNRHDSASFAKTYTRDHSSQLDCPIKLAAKKQKANSCFFCLLALIAAFLFQYIKNIEMFFEKEANKCIRIFFTAEVTSTKTYC